MSNLAFWIGFGIGSIIFGALFAVIFGRFFLNRDSDIDHCGWVETFDDDPVENDPRNVSNLDDIYTASVANGALNMPLHDGEVTR